MGLDTVRNLEILSAPEAISLANKRRLDMLKIRAGLLIHADATPAISVANATDLPSAIALITQLQTSYTAHIGSACDATTGQGAHMAADATNVLTSPVPTDLASSETAINEIKTQYNAHRVSTVFHPVADSTNTLSTANGTDLATTIALANAAKTALNGHFAMAMNAPAVLLVNP